jgi:hypothetical protein
MSLQDFVTQLVKKLDLGSLESEANGVYQIPLENGTMITLLETEEGGYRLYSTFAAVPEKKKETFLVPGLPAPSLGWMNWVGSWF